jgi:outer membrane protein TolC
MKRFAVVTGLLFSTPTHAQDRAPRDSLRLAPLIAEAEQRDPRVRNTRLLGDVAELRLDNLAAERLPSLTAAVSGQQQSDVFRFPLSLPGQSIPAARKDNWDAQINVRQTLFDATWRTRRAAEVASRDEQQAQVAVGTYALRHEVIDAFFTAAGLQQRAATIALTIDNLAARLREAATRVREGVALPSDTAALAASILLRRQDVLQARSDVAAAMARLALLTGRTLTVDTPLAMPPRTDREVPAVSGLRRRPEYAQFAAARERLSRLEDVEASSTRPRLALIGRLGYGRPALNPLATSFDTYWVTGVQLQWSPWNWHTTDRARQALAVQRQMVESNEAAFTQAIERGIQQALATDARLDSTLALDAQVVTLREQIEREAGNRLREGVITSAEYIDRSSELLVARLALAQHRIEQAQARALLHVLLGVDLP